MLDQAGELRLTTPVSGRPGERDGRWIAMTADTAAPAPALSKHRGAHLVAS